MALFPPQSEFLEYLKTTDEKFIAQDGDYCPVAKFLQSTYDDKNIQFYIDFLYINEEEVHEVPEWASSFANLLDACYDDRVDVTKEQAISIYNQLG